MAEIEKYQEEELVKGCKEGKSRYQEALYKMYSRKLFGVCILYTRDRTAAEDIMQEGFIKIFEHIKQYDGRGSLGGWMRRIMVNTALERFRRQNRLYTVADIAPLVTEFSFDDIIGKIAADELHQIIAELSPQYKIVFLLYAIEGYSHKEIAEKLEISEGTSKSNLSRARVILQEKVKEFYFSNRKKQEVRC